MVHKLNQSLPFYPVGSRQLDDTGNTFRKKRSSFPPLHVREFSLQSLYSRGSSKPCLKNIHRTQLVPNFNSNLFAEDQIDPFKKLESIAVKLPL